jgi:hypothetical protein
LFEDILAPTNGLKIEMKQQAEPNGISIKISDTVRTSSSTATGGGGSDDLFSDHNFEININLAGSFNCELAFGNNKKTQKF